MNPVVRTELPTPPSSQPALEARCLAVGVDNSATATDRTNVTYIWLDRVQTNRATSVFM
jgi:hypothetical protein